MYEINLLASHLYDRGLLSMVDEIYTIISILFRFRFKLFKLANQF